MALRTFTAAALVALGCACATGKQARHPERPLAPLFSTVDVGGATVSLEALRGKVVVLDFWATWCEPCRDEVPQLVALQKAEGPRGLQLVGFSMDDDDAPVRAFYREQSMNYPVAMGDAALGKQFGGVLGVPVKVLIDREGRVAGRHTGAFDVAKLTEEVRALLAE